MHDKMTSTTDHFVGSYSNYGLGEVEIIKSLGKHFEIPAESRKLDSIKSILDNFSLKYLLSVENKTTELCFIK